MESKMTAIQEVKFWVDVIEQAALSQTYRALAQTALYAADKHNNTGESPMN